MYVQPKEEKYVHHKRLFTLTSMWPGWPCRQA